MSEEWDLNDDWKLMEVGNVADFQNGYSFNDDYWENEGDPIIRIQNLTGTGDDFNYYSGDDVEDKYRVNNGDILFAWSATLGCFKWDGNDAWLNQHIYRVEPDTEKVNKEYIYYFLDYAAKRLEKRMVGGTLQHVRKSDVTEYKIPVPPLDEQERIVEAVEERLDRIERLEQSVENISRLSEEYRDSYIAFLSSGLSVDSDAPVDGIPNEDELPDNWDLVSITDIADVNPRIDTEESEDYAYVPMDAVSSETQEVERFDRRDSTYSSLATFQEEDILFARITPCFENGKIAVVPSLPDGYDYAVGSSEFAVIRPENVRTDYLHMYLTSPVIGEWGEHRLTGATGRERIRVGEIKNELYVPLPPEDEQEKIVQDVRKTDFNKIRVSVDSLEDRFEEYRNSVLAHAFQGEY